MQFCTTETYSVTWINFSKSILPRIDMFEDPVYSTYVEKDIFIEMYNKALETLDGSDMSSFVDFYFQSSPINQSIYIFKDENAKLDFMDIAIECGLLPELEEVMAGETKSEKRLRNNRETQVNRPKKSKSTKCPLSQRSQQCEKTMAKLMTKLHNETDIIMRQKLEQKIKQTMKHIETSV